MIFGNFSLKNHNTFGLDVRASGFCRPSSENEVADCLLKELPPGKPFMIMGGGSNLLFTRDYKGVIIQPAIGGIWYGKPSGDEIEVTVGAGVVWDDFVNQAVSVGLGGTENLSLIPGHTGAAAVQNIGAYGTEVSEIIAAVKAIETSTGKRRIFTTQECKFSYRYSIFKDELKGKYIITSVTFRLSRKPQLRLSYGNLSEEAEKKGKATLSSVREAVIGIRQSKLPNPAITGNAGSFFKNPVVPAEKAQILLKQHQSMPVYPAGENCTKVAAGWLIEQCGWKGYRSGDAGVHDKQALVLVNHGNATGNEIFELSEKIRQSVAEKFGIDLEREVEII
ncbi:MAG: UDP-N-acetylmuramate dehydrogenase [Bacteroidetes bacterium]|nr:UDP-N-acetylmuramate dehydrogenase [Bacteroidota bacterium]